MNETKKDISWTPEMEASLRGLLNDGLSYRLIAKAITDAFSLPMSRSAIAGKITRMGWRSELLSLVPKPVEPEPEPEPKTELLLACTLFDLRPHSCRWPVDRKDEQHLFCGELRVQGRPYCDKHTKISYV